jgi:hypothetical protein
MKRKLGVVATAGALAASLILVLTACGGNDDPDGVASLTDTTGQTTTEGSGSNGSSAPSEEEREEAELEFAQCMREHGIDFPDPQFEEGGGILQMMPEGTEDDPKFEEAQEACQPILDAVQPDGPPAEEEGEGT